MKKTRLKILANLEENQLRLNEAGKDYWKNIKVPSGCAVVRR